jgi:hypothetical protein
VPDTCIDTAQMDNTITPTRHNQTHIYTEHKKVITTQYEYTDHAYANKVSMIGNNNDQQNILGEF